jgi:hypothetical protein
MVLLTEGMGLNIRGVGKVKTWFCLDQQTSPFQLVLWLTEICVLVLLVFGFLFPSSSQSHAI